ncbi:hypothetical protein A0H81_03326 [Grifola frondosa]|uniref:Uncharacterized protein n=1 Tax=Grifola frondosa TaxID=5627 RepID=A0A1C7MID2_GRIFR|nr:hypothetical protein A0H81_03326 [Grifola frondosa]
MLATLGSHLAYSAPPPLYVPHDPVYFQHKGTGAQDCTVHRVQDVYERMTCLVRATDRLSRSKVQHRVLCDRGDRAGNGRTELSR